ncbi:MAG: M48 family metalloprotease [Gammaproteobacteria bacterium]|nr:M48 family metalloprotease [Gammaproteobacteria bacterium]
MGTYRFAQDHNELQPVIAHELAHNTEGHVSKSVTNSL